MEIFKNRFTPTGVGKTTGSSFTPTPQTVHPHGCGENFLTMRRKAWPHLGSPPRVWGKRRSRTGMCTRLRFTPTGVGKTVAFPNHFIKAGGSPPRVWGKLRIAWEGRGVKTVHPHGCGENSCAEMGSIPEQRFTPTGVGKTPPPRPALSAISGSPPRVWGKLFPELIHCHPKPVHPHGCGENSPVFGSNMTTIGSPPRVWGKHCIVSSGNS